MELNLAYILLGGNIDPRSKYLQIAGNKIITKAGTLIKTSGIYESRAWGFDSGNAFLNKMLLVETALNAEDLLSGLLQIEKECGRNRIESGSYGDRTLDADIIYFNRDIINKENLIVPHPRMQLRRFVLKPLFEIAPGFIHPVLQLSTSELLSQCNDDSKVIKYNEL